MTQFTYFEVKDSVFLFFELSVAQPTSFNTFGFQ